jgi:hypothetical protein
MPIYKIETVSLFKHVYFIEAKELSHALDELLCAEVEETDQVHLDETVFSTKRVSLEEFKESLTDAMNGYMGMANIHRIDYGRDR